AYEMTSMLEAVIESGTGTAAAIGQPAAGKTGTTDDNKDAWFVGYTPTIVTAVWVGDDTGAHSLGEIYGGTVPARIWHDYMVQAASSDSSDFSVPAGMQKASRASETKSTTTEKKSTKSTTTKEKTKQDTQQGKQQAARNNKNQ
ncbi:MAG: penicillin-binding transpeptidase domain-containing protein, partial [Caecibacter massiliensis]|nr:penicillin-binding transpeptidase domain-containing protein [Caecibacter massiliensis]